MADQTAVISIEGMSCGHCVMRVEKGVSAMPGVSSAKVDLAGKKATVAFDPAAVTEAAIRAKIQEIGYQPV